MRSSVPLDLALWPRVAPLPSSRDGFARVPRRAIRAFVSVAMLLPATALAGPIYFHKPMVERAAFVADATECEELASGVKAPRQLATYQPNIYSAAAAGFLSGFMASRERRGMADNVLRTCMADKGYRRVDGSLAVKQRLKDAKAEARLAVLATLAAAPEPDGKLLPR